MHWENKFSLFLEYFQTHFQFLSSTHHVEKKKQQKK